MTAPAPLSMPAALSMVSKTVLVTGAANGIGRATAQVLAQLGATLVISDRAPLDQTRDEIHALGAVCSVVQGDLTDDAFIAAFFAGEQVHAMAH